jgi:hypothetical protein
MSQAITAIRSARIHLNDINGITWSDVVLMPILQEAHAELVQELERFSLPVILNQSSIILVTAGSLNLGVNQPANLVDPISMMERIPGSTLDDFEDMVKVTFLPLENQTQELNYWAWIGENIQFLGALSNREVLLRYQGSVTTPQLTTDPLGFIFAERYIGPRIASIAKFAIGQDGSKLQELAEMQLYKIIQSNVTNDQRPVRRRPYRSFKEFYGPDYGNIT